MHVYRVRLLLKWDDDRVVDEALFLDRDRAEQHVGDRRYYDDEDYRVVVEEVEVDTRKAGE